MKKYKLLKDLPNVNKGEILSPYHWEIEHLMYPKEHPDWFAPYVLTTEDGVDVFVNDTYWFVFKDKKLNWTDAIKQSGKNKHNKRFSTKEKAQEYLKKKQIQDLCARDHELCVYLSKESHNFCNLEKVEHFKKEPQLKLITEEGDKLYGDDKCFLVRDWATNKINYDSWARNGINGKYFTKEENAQQYFAELQAKKRGIEVGDTLFDKRYKFWVGKVKSILYYTDDMFNQGESVSLDDNTGEQGVRLLKNILTLEELVKKEWESKQIPKEELIAERNFDSTRCIWYCL